MNTLTRKLILFFLVVIQLQAFGQLPGKIHLGLIYPISSNGRKAIADTNDLSIHLIAGVSAAERGLAFAGISNVILNDAIGSQFAGFSNHIGGRANGTQFAGFANTYGEGKGAAFAGFINVARRNVIGSQFAGFANLARNVRGTQFAGFLNYTNNLKGAQFAGFINLANKNVSNSQFAGFINTARDVNGTQVAGFINVARKVKGPQIAGFVNVADSSDYPIGIINLIRNGEKSIGLSVDETKTAMLSFRSGGKALYGIIGLGYNFKEIDHKYAAELGFGAHFFNSNCFSLNSELIASTLVNFGDKHNFKASLRALPNFKFFNSIGIFGGPSLNLITTNTNAGKQLYTKNLYHWNSKWSDDYYAAYLGYVVGIHFFL